MKTIKRTRAVSHKKVTTTAVNVKVEALNATKRHKLNEASSATSASAASGNGTTVTTQAGGDTSVIRTQPSTVAFGSSKKQSGLMLKIGGTKIYIPFRDNKDNFTNLLPQMSKEIQCNFNKKDERRHDQNNNTRRRSDWNTAARNTQQDHIEINNNTNYSYSENIIRDIHLDDYSRCYVEDYMLVEVVETILILIPSCYIQTDNFWSEILKSEINKTEIRFSKQTYFGLNATVLTNPFLS